LGDIRADYHKKPFDIIVHDITTKGANKLMAFGKHRSHTSVEQYLFSKYKITLNYSDLPCIAMSGGKGHISYYAIETLYVCEDDLDSITQEMKMLIAKN
jgi:hypothetical protein